MVNIAGGVGHIISELDFFFRQRRMGMIDPRRRCIWVRKPDCFSQVCVDFYANRFWYAKANYFLYHFLLPMTMAFPEITLDCGLSRLKWQLNKDRCYFKPALGQTYLHQISRQENSARWCYYYSLRSQCANFFPLANKDLRKDSRSFLTPSDNKLALIHLKTQALNATALITEPLTYLPALESLLAKGYDLVFVGREKMPIEFVRLPIYNYA